MNSTPSPLSLFTMTVALLSSSTFKAGPHKPQTSPLLAKRLLQEASQDLLSSDRKDVTVSLALVGRWGHRI